MMIGQTMKDITLEVRSVKEVTSGQKTYSVIVLEDPISKRILPISAPAKAAEYITSALAGELNDRPDVYSLVSSMMRAMGTEMTHVTIEKSPNTTKPIYNANMCVTSKREDGSTFFAVLQGRPSDVIPMAILQGADIRAAEDLLNDPQD